MIYMGIKMNKNAVSVIIPAYKPDEKLMILINDLLKAGFSDLLVVDDGSGEESSSVFQKIKEIPECTLLCHEVNRGKGAALKTAMEYFVKNRPDRLCVVTVDADGQHLLADIEAVASASLNTERVVLGVRSFSASNIPARSVWGNRITSLVFLLFFGMRIRDTQTGLRGFPRKYIPQLLCVKGDRYEYETNVLFWMNSQNIPYEQVDITTVYLEENRSSHFRVVWDSIRIYGLILKYLFSSVGAAVIDEVLFYLLKYSLFLTILPIPSTFSAAFLARVISSFVNYRINARHVFKNEVTRGTFVRYYTLATAQIALSAVLVFLIEQILHISSPAISTIVKTAVDTALFFFSFRIQHQWVFNHRRKTEWEWEESA